MESKPKNPDSIVVLAKVLVWVMLLHGALMIAVGSALVADPFAFSSNNRGGIGFLLQCFGFLVVFAGASNMLAAVLFFRRSVDSKLGIYLAVALNVLVCLLALLGYGRYIYLRREFASVVFWWYCFMTLNVLLVVMFRHPSVVSWCKKARAPRGRPESGFPVIVDEDR